jgi:hypothetical protein
MGQNIIDILPQLYYFPVPLQVGQIIFLSPPQLLHGLPFTLPEP